MTGELTVMLTVPLAVNYWIVHNKYNLNVFPFKKIAELKSVRMKKTLFQSNLFKSLTTYHGKTIRSFSKPTTANDADIDEEATDDSPANILFEEDDIELREATIEKNRNKSRLLPQHLKMLNDTVPYSEAQSWIHNTIKYKRMMFGRYGLASGVDPRLCFYTKNELDAQQEYERVAYPFTLQEMIKTNAKANAEKEEKIRKREDDIDKKMAKLDTWTKELNAKIAKKEADTKAAKERKERIVEEVRRQFGFKLDVRDERFQTLLAQKEKEDKKKQKEERRKVKEEKMLAKLQQETKVPDTEKPAT